MSDISGGLARVREAFERPTLRLLDRKWAPLVLAVFKTSFSRDQRSVGAERLHTQVDTYLEELRSVGEDTPRAIPRSLIVTAVALCSHELEGPHPVAADPFCSFLDGASVFQAE